MTFFIIISFVMTLLGTIRAWILYDLIDINITSKVKGKIFKMEKGRRKGVI